MDVGVSFPSDVNVNRSGRIQNQGQILAGVGGNAGQIAVDISRETFYLRLLLLVLVLVLVLRSLIDCVHASMQRW